MVIRNICKTTILQAGLNYEFLYRAWDELQEGRYGRPKLERHRFHHREERRNGTTKGQYRFRLPHGKVQVVSYKQMKDEYLAKVQFLNGDEDNNCLGVKEGCTLGLKEINVGSFEGHIAQKSHKSPYHSKIPQFLQSTSQIHQNNRITSTPSQIEQINYEPTNVNPISTTRRPTYSKTASFSTSQSPPALFIKSTDVTKSPGLYKNIKTNSGVMYGINNQVVVAYNYGSGIPKLKFGDAPYKDDSRESLEDNNTKKPQNDETVSNNNGKNMNEKIKAYFDPIIIDVPLKYFPPQTKPQGHSDYYIPSDKIITIVHAQGDKRTLKTQLSRGQLNRFSLMHERRNRANNFRNLTNLPKIHQSKSPGATYSTPISTQNPSSETFYYIPQNSGQKSKVPEQNIYVPPQSLHEPPPHSTYLTQTYEPPPQSIYILQSHEPPPQNIYVPQSLEPPAQNIYVPQQSSLEPPQQNTYVLQSHKPPSQNTYVLQSHEPPPQNIYVPQLSAAQQSFRNFHAPTNKLYNDPNAHSPSIISLRPSRLTSSVSVQRPINYEIGNEINPQTILRLNDYTTIEPTTYKPEYVPIFVRRPEEPIDPSFLNLPSFIKTADQNTLNLFTLNSYGSLDGRNIDSLVVPTSEAHNTQQPSDSYSSNALQYLLPPVNSHKISLTVPNVRNSETIQTHSATLNNERLYSGALHKMSQKTKATDENVHLPPSRIFPPLPFNYNAITRSPNVQKLQPAVEILPVTTFHPRSYSTSKLESVASEINLQIVPQDAEHTKIIDDLPRFSNSVSSNGNDITTFITKSINGKFSQYIPSQTTKPLHSFQPSLQFSKTIIKSHSLTNNSITLPVESKLSEHLSTCNESNQHLLATHDETSKISGRKRTRSSRITFPTHSPTTPSVRSHSNSSAENLFSRPIIPETNFVPASSSAISNLGDVQMESSESSDFKFKEFFTDTGIRNSSVSQLSSDFKAEIISENNLPVSKVPLLNPHTEKPLPLYPPIGDADYETSIIRFPSGNSNFPLSERRLFREIMSPTLKDKSDGSVFTTFTAPDEYHSNFFLRDAPTAFSEVRRYASPFISKTRKISSNEFLRTSRIYPLSGSFPGPTSSSFAELQNMKPLSLGQSNHSSHHLRSIDFINPNRHSTTKRHSFPSQSVIRLLPVAYPVYGRAMIPHHPLSRTLTVSRDRTI